VGIIGRMPTYHAMDKTLFQIETAFTYHPPQPGQAERYKLLRDKAHELAVLVTQETPPSREQSQALTNLEQVIMWANAAIARNETAPRAA
jgi:hypothetical protein